MTALAPSSPAPLFELNDLNGEPWRLADWLARGPVWLFFLKGDCPTCGLVAPFIRRAHEELAGPALTVAAVMEEGPAAAARFSSAHGWALPVAAEPGPYRVSSACGLATVPTHFLIEADGRVARSGEGFVRSEWNEVAAELAARAGRPGFELIRDSDGAPALRPG